MALQIQYKLKESTIRKLYAISKNENAVHASDRLDSANREIDIWFAD